ncbi:hypothetical protein BDR07DRAFT_1481670 [Suillus spraguei]|nr:hypothetical protein BDR07DRAFT_1481670 [Suillus spraguei]
MVRCETKRSPPLNHPPKPSAHTHPPFVSHPPVSHPPPHTGPIFFPPDILPADDNMETSNQEHHLTPKTIPTTLEPDTNSTSPTTPPIPSPSSRIVLQGKESPSCDILLSRETPNQYSLANTSSDLAQSIHALKDSTMDTTMGAPCTTTMHHYAPNDEEKTILAHIALAERN